MSSSDKSSSSSSSPPDESPEIETPPVKETIPIRQGGFPWVIRYLIHFIILWGVFYIIYQPESNFINYINAALLVIWSVYNLLAPKMKWPSFP
jgi:hypothetical protein